MKPRLRSFLIGGIVACVGGPFLGFFCTVLSMAGAFRSMGSGGVGDPSGLAQHLGWSLTLTSVGMGISVLGFLTIAVVLILHFFPRTPPPPKGRERERADI